MKRAILTMALSAFPAMAIAENSIVAGIVNAHILPRFEHLADTSQTLASVSEDHCTATDATLRTAYSEAFDAWIAAGHLRFGPSEVDDRAFAIGFWPDSRGKTPKALGKLISDRDPVVANAASYADVSIAARGFYALEVLLYDATLSTTGDADYRCHLIQTITADTALMSAAIAHEWENDYAVRMIKPSKNGTYRSDAEVTSRRSYPNV